MKQKKSKKRSKASKRTRTTAKNGAWKVFSLYIRTRDCLRTTGKPDRGICISCGLEFDIKDLQAGHLIHGGDAVKFHEEIVNAQCCRCNKWLHGNLVRYMIELMKRGITRQEIESWCRLKGTTVKRKIADYDEIKAKYIKKLRELLGGTR